MFLPPILVDERPEWSLNPSYIDITLKAVERLQTRSVFMRLEEIMKLSCKGVDCVGGQLHSRDKCDQTGNSLCRLMMCSESDSANTATIDLFDRKDAGFMFDSFTWPRDSPGPRQ